MKSMPRMDQYEMINSRFLKLFCSINWKSPIEYCKQPDNSLVGQKQKQPDLENP